MVNHNDSDHDDLLEQATQALRQTPVPAEPSGDTRAEVVAALEDAANQPHTLTFSEKVFAMNTLTKITAAGSSVLVVCGVLLWMITVGGSASIALADVADKLDKITSATWTQTVTIEGIEPQTVKTFYLEPSRRRAETSQGMVMIFDESKMVMLTAENKFAVVVTLENAPDDGITKNWLEDLRQRIHEAVGGSKDDVAELGRHKIDGRDAVGFHLRVNNAEMDVWADPVTALPIRVEGTSRLTEPALQHVMSEFRYNVELDESLFSLEIPPDYTVQEMSMDASKPTEGDLVELLKAYAAEQEDSLFPPSLGMIAVQQGMTVGIMERMIAKFLDGKNDPEMMKTPEMTKKMVASDEYKELIEVSKKLGRGLGFLETLSPDIDQHYAGKDVKLNTPDRPIFWYKPAGSESYRVIYADLSVKEVAAEAVKGFPAASDPE